MPLMSSRMRSAARGLLGFHVDGHILALQLYGLLRQSRRATLLDVVETRHLHGLANELSLMGAADVAAAMKRTTAPVNRGGAHAGRHRRGYTTFPNLCVW